MVIQIEFVLHLENPIKCVHINESNQPIYVCDDKNWKWWLQWIRSIIGMLVESWNIVKLYLHFVSVSKLKLMHSKYLISHRWFNPSGKCHLLLWFQNPFKPKCIAVYNCNCSLQYENLMKYALYTNTAKCVSVCRRYTILYAYRCTHCRHV